MFKMYKIFWTTVKNTAMYENNPNFVIEETDKEYSNVYKMINHKHTYPYCKICKGSEDGDPT